MSASRQQQHDRFGEVRARLDEWGAWMRGLAGAGTGCSRVTVIRSTGGHEPENEMAEEIDQILARLKLRQRDLWSVVKFEYWHREANVIAADKLGISVATYKNRRLLAEHYVAGCLEERASFTKKG